MRTARFQTRVLLVLLVALGACLATAPGALAQKRTCKNAGAQAGQVSQRKLARATVCLLNNQRRARGLRPLKMSKRLGGAARGHSAEMAQSNYFSHDSRSGASFLDRIRRAGYLRRARRWSVGENIAWGTGRLSTPRSIVRACSPELLTPQHCAERPLPWPSSPSDGWVSSSPAICACAVVQPVASVRPAAFWLAYFRSPSLLRWRLPRTIPT